MRQMPFTSERFDAAIRSPTSGADVMKTFADVKRVLRPGGDFLIVVINRDAWMKFVFPLLHGHYFGSRPMRELWLIRFRDAGYTVIEDGHLPGCLYMLANLTMVESDGQKADDPR